MHNKQPDIRNEYLVLRASAGSGKTFCLVLRFVYLLCKGAKAWEILTLTFTKKASNEMRVRIQKSLKNLYEDSINNTLQNNDTFLALQANGIDEEFIKNHIAEIYKNFMQAHPRITTIDSFFYTILQKFCWHAGVSSAFEIIQYDEESLYETFVQSLNANEREGIVNFCFFNNLDIKGFLSLINTFSEQKGVLKQKNIQATLQEVQNDIHSKMEYLRQEITTKPKISQRGIDALNYETIEELSAKTWLKEHNPNAYLYWKKFDLNYLNEDFIELRKLLCTYYQIKQNVIFKQINNSIQIFKNAKANFLRQNNMLIYDDITNKVYDLLHSNIDKEFFYFRLDDRIMHILLDEFQDTSIIQYEILRPLIDEILSGKGRIEHRSVFVVGDEKQSIYSFRGAFPAVFNTIQKTPFITQSLTKNYRSKSVIVEYVNEVFSKQYADYIPQELPDTQTKTQGFLNVKEFDEFDENAVYKAVCYLLENGVSQNDISILTWKNDEVKRIKDFLKIQNPSFNIIAETTQNFFDLFPCNVLIQALKYQCVSEQKHKNFHKKNIAKLLGKKFEHDISLPEFKGNVGQYVYAVIESFALGCAMSARFLEKVCEYEDINDFLRSYQSLETATLKEHLNGIKIMTIHKSKGLEFEHLIVCDRFSNKDSDKNKFIKQYEDIILKDIYFKWAGRENVDEDYKEAFQSYNQMKQNEATNVLYVALTRAKSSLSILKKQKNSAFATLNLMPTQIGVLTASTDISHNKESHKNQYIPLQNLGKQDDFIQNQRESSALNIPSILFGNALHSCFEYYFGMKETHLPTLWDILQNLYGFSLPQDTLKTVQARFQNALANPHLQTILSSGTLFSEVSYLHENKSYRIDTLVVAQNEVIVLDYKSSKEPKDEHFTQVRKYMDFLKTLSTNPIKGYLIYPAASQMCVEVQSLPPT